MSRQRYRNSRETTVVGRNGNHEFRCLRAVIVEKIMKWIGKAKGKNIDEDFKRETAHFLKEIEEAVIECSLRKEAPAAQEREGQLEKSVKKLNRSITVLKTLASQITIERDRANADVTRNVNVALVPLFQMLQKNCIPKQYIELWKWYTKEIASAFNHELTKGRMKLSCRETEICNLVRGGLASKDIAALLCVSRPTVESHRKNIRKKLGICNNGINLTSYLRV